MSKVHGVNLPTETHEKLKEYSEETGISIVKVIGFLVKESDRFKEE